MLLFVWALCAVFVIVMVDLSSRRRKLNACVQNLPRIPTTELLAFLRPKKTSVELFQCLEKIFNYYDGLTACLLGTRLAVICDDPVNMKTILMSKNCVNKPYLYRLIPASGDGLFTANGHEWRTDRKSMNAVFTSSILKKNHHPIFNRHSANLVKTLEKYVGQPEIDFTAVVITSNFDVVLETTCRRKTTRDEDAEKANIIQHLAKFWQIATKRACNTFLHPRFLHRFSKLYAEEKKVCEFLLRQTPKLLLYPNEDLAQVDEEKTDNVDSKSMILIDKLIELEQHDLMDRKRVLDQISAFTVAGVDTTSVTMLNTLLLLAMNQNVQDRLYDEIRTTVTNDAYVDYDTLPKLEYMERVLKESMRLLPLSHFWARETDDDVKLVDCILPKGTIIYLCVLKMHRDEKIWGPTALEFDPDRFLPEAAAQRHPFAFLPFSGGPRNCIGNKYAMMSMKVMLCHLLLKYKLTTSMRMSDLVFKFEFLLKLDNKYMFKLERRTAGDSIY